MTLDIEAIERRAARWTGPAEAELFSVGTVRALLAARADLVAALAPFAAIPLARDSDDMAPDMIDAPDLAITAEDVRRARAALLRSAEASQEPGR